MLTKVSNLGVNGMRKEKQGAKRGRQSPSGGGRREAKAGVLAAVTHQVMVGTTTNMARAEGILRPVIGVAARAGIGEAAVAAGAEAEVGSAVAVVVVLSRTRTTKRARGCLRL